MMHSAESGKLRLRATKESIQDINRNHIEDKAQKSSVHQFEGSELEATIKVENYNQSDGDLVANFVKSELIEYHDNTSTLLNQISDINPLTLEKTATTTETKILGDEPTTSSDEDDYIPSDRHSSSDPERDPFEDVDCDPYVFQNLSNRSNSEYSATQQHELINSADVISNSNVEASLKNVVPSTNTGKHNRRCKTPALELKCRVCLETQNTKKKLESHMKICTASHKNRFRFCVPCNKLFSNLQRYRHHTFIFHRIGKPSFFSKSFKCQVCPRSFANEESVLAHSVLHQERKNTKEMEGTERVNNLPVLINPVIYLVPALRLDPECSERDFDPSKYCHVKLEDNFILGDLPSTSKLTAISDTGLHAPLSSKIVSSAVPAPAPAPTARKHFKCKLCSKLLTSLSQLKVHLQVCVTQPKNRNRFCVPCNEIFPDSWKLRHHNRRLHPTREDKADCESSVQESKECSKMKCKLCPQEFMAAAELQKHVDLHKKIPIEPANNLLHVFRCQVCSLFFRTENQLTEHLRYHLDDCYK